MKKVEIKINGNAVNVAEETTILYAAREVGVKIPSLCAHPDLKPWAACGICVVKVEGSPRLIRACSTKVVEGTNYITHDPELQDVRRTVIEMTLADHPNECLSCLRSGSCELQKLAADFGITEHPFEPNVKPKSIDDSTGSIILEERKCIQCGRCALTCQTLQDVWALEFLNRGYETVIHPAGNRELAKSPCIKCGQCSAHCPVGAIYEKDETRIVYNAIQSDKHVAVQIAPSVRVAIGEEFGLPPGTVTTGKLYSALRRLGFDAIFDTNFGADLTIMEEGSEFVERLGNKGSTLPQITSCCPAWTDYMEKYFPDMIPNFSSAKSPMMMQGALTKTYYAEKKGIDAKNIYSVAVMPCTAKKYEITRDDNMYSSGEQDVDVVLTTRELARMIKSSGVDFANLEEEKADSPIGEYSGAGTIFGVTGGVMEAAIRTAYHLVTNEELENVEVDAVRGMDGIKRGEVDVKGTKVKVAVAHGIANVRDILNEVRQARDAGDEPPYHFIEVMACRGGCIAGGGQPYGTIDDVRSERTDGIYVDDRQSKKRCSHENPEIQQVYKEYLGKPLSEKAHHLLHTEYTPRPIYRK